MAIQEAVRFRSNVNAESGISGASTHACSEIKLEIGSGGGMNEPIECSSVCDGKIIRPLTRNIEGVSRQVKQEIVRNIDAGIPLQMPGIKQELDYEAVKYKENGVPDLKAGIKQEVNYEAAWCVKTEGSEIDENQKQDCELCMASKECYNNVIPEAVSWDRNCLLRGKAEQPEFYEGNEKSTQKLKACLKSEDKMEHDDVFSEITWGNEHSFKIENKTGDLCCTSAVRSSTYITEQRRIDVGESVDDVCYQAVDVDVNVNQDRNSVGLCSADGNSSPENALSFSRQSVQYNARKLNVSDELRCNKKVAMQKHLICKFCDEQFAESALLQTHLLETHNRAFTKLILDKITHIGEKPYKCDVCEKTFSRTSDVKIHKRMHTGEKPYKCDVCDKTFSSTSYVKIHKRIHTGEKPYKCDACDKDFCFLSEVKIHKRIHIEEKRYKCDVCDKDFSYPSQVKIHKRIHTGEKSYKCDVCDKDFCYSSQIKIHKRRHTGEKPYKCDVCEKTFSRTSEVKIHKRIHTGEKPYKCDVCGVKFARSGALNRHRRVHT